jgi:4-carboxymuconolactone decarboxylase
VARIPYFDPSKAAGKAVKVYDALPQPYLNIFRMMGHSGDLLEAFSRFGGYLLNRTSLDPVLREIAIVRVGVLSKASYEVHQHEAISRRIGMSDELIKAIHEGPAAPVFTDLQRQVMAYTDDVVANVRASDPTFLPLRHALGDKALQELTIVIGFYMLVSRFLETFDVDIEAAGEAPVVRVSGEKS